MFTLPPLNYNLDALEPFLSAKQIDLHYNKHHKAYVDKLNQLLKYNSIKYKSIEDIIRFGSNAQPTNLVNNAAQHYNHSFYWKSMTPHPSSSSHVSMDLNYILEKSFGNMNIFAKNFVYEAMNHFGSGWVWLIWDGNVDQLDIITTHDAGCPLGFNKLVPLFNCDLWEHCYSADTEVLTKRGWLSWPDVIEDDIFATRSEDKEFEWQKATNIYRGNYNGNLYRFYNKSIELKVTPSHRMLFATVHQNNVVKEQIELAKDLIKRADHYVHLIGTSKWKGIPIKEKTWGGDSEKIKLLISQRNLLFLLKQENYNWNTITSLTGVTPVKYAWMKKAKYNLGTGYKQPIYMDGNDYCAFMGMYLSEGNTYEKEGKIYINQRSESKGYSSYKDLLKRILGREPLFIDDHYFVFARKELQQWLSQFGLSNEKYIPDDIMNSTPEQISTFLFYYFLGDGNIGNNYSLSISTTSERMANQLVELAQKIGRSASIVYSKECKKVIDNKEYICKPGYSVRFHKSEFHNVRNELIPYNGIVYCASVPNGTLYVRTKYKLPVWSGNSYYVTYENRKEEYLQKFIANLVNWEFAAENFRNRLSKIENVYR